MSDRFACGGGGGRGEKRRLWASTCRSASAHSARTRSPARHPPHHSHGLPPDACSRSPCPASTPRTTPRPADTLPLLASRRHMRLLASRTACGDRAVALRSASPRASLPHRATCRGAHGSPARDNMCTRRDEVCDGEPTSVPACAVAHRPAARAAPRVPRTPRSAHGLCSPHAPPLYDPQRRPPTAGYPERLCRAARLRLEITHVMYERARCTGRRRPKLNEARARSRVDRGCVSTAETFAASALLGGMSVTLSSRDRPHVCTPSVPPASTTTACCSAIVEVLLRCTQDTYRACVFV